MLAFNGVSFQATYHQMKQSKCFYLVLTTVD